jgi:hypothetical protein
LRLEEFSLGTPEEAREATEHFQARLEQIAQKLQVAASLQRSCLVLAARAAEVEEKEHLQ